MNVFEVGYYDYDGTYCTTWAEDNACYGYAGEPCYYVARVFNPNGVYQEYIVAPSSQHTH